MLKIHTLLQILGCNKEKSNHRKKSLHNCYFVKFFFLNYHKNNSHHKKMFITINRIKQQI